MLRCFRLLPFLLLAFSAVSPAQTPAPEPVTVRTAPVTANGESAAPLRFAGIVQARQRATLTFQVSGTLTDRQVELGERVAAGQVLARVDNPGLEPGRDSAEARLDELKTQLAQAERELKRSRRLYERGVVSEQNLEQLKARRDSLKASVATARASLAEADQMVAESALTAPFGGRVEALMVEEGEFVGVGQPVMRLSSPDGREVEIRVPAYLLGQVERGQTLPVWSVQNRDAGSVDGRVVEIAQPGSVRGELHPILVALPKDSLSVGLPVEVGVQPRLRASLTVPLLSVMRSSGGTSVFVVRDGKVRRVPVTVDRIIGERVAIESGALSADEPVVYSGMTKLLDGDPVEVRR
ncbi:efflux RND transporter periplasmic adaptor subunit [Tamilnaduibacter salinus]|nr:efflux RND transporter periplasmic adaptor subunit [Tamilnaduibacter salinus]